MSAPDLSRGVRASDAERERIAELLQRAAAEGRLSPEEAGERLAAASATTYRDELNQLVRDLPVPRARAPRDWLLLRSAVRLALLAGLVVTFWGFWGVRLLLLPLAFMAVAFLLRGRRRRWRRLRGWGWAWGVATDPENRS
jgi:uncharacterized protein DUF1707